MLDILIHGGLIVQFVAAAFSVVSIIATSRKS